MDDEELVKMIAREKDTLNELLAMARERNIDVKVIVNDVMGHFVQYIDIKLSQRLL